VAPELVDVADEVESLEVQNLFVEVVLEDLQSLLEVALAFLAVVLAVG